MPDIGESVRGMVQKGVEGWRSDDEEGGGKNLWELFKGAFGATVVRPVAEKALSMESTQKMGAEVVEKSLREAVEQTRQNLEPMLAEAGAKAMGGVEGTVLENAQKLLGAGEGKWYVRWGKRVAARVLNWALPVVSFISAGIAGRMVNKADDESAIGGLRGSFGKIYEGLLGRMANAKAGAGS